MSVVNCFRSLYLWVDLQRICTVAACCAVVNCFRSLYLWVDLQLPPDNLYTLAGCELLSFFVPLGWFTAITVNTCTVNRLWIAFVLCTFGLIYSEIAQTSKSDKVVNCFRSLYLWVDLQRGARQDGRRQVVNCFRSLYLWVDLQPITEGFVGNSVVNCFRSLYLWVDLQPSDSIDTPR